MLPILFLSCIRVKTTYCNNYFIDRTTPSTVVLHFTSLIKPVLNKAKGYTYKIYQTNYKSN